LGGEPGDRWAHYRRSGEPARGLIDQTSTPSRTGFPPLLIQVGENEALFDDARRLCANAKAAGVDVALEVYPDTVPTFHQFNFMPEAESALSSFGRFAATALSRIRAGG
jgi:acetyl esterase/lipase